MAGIRTGISGNPKFKEAQVGCTDAVCGTVEAIENVDGGGKRKMITICIGAEKPLKVASSWSVVLGDRVAVATVGSFCGDMEVRIGNFGGVETTGRLLDAATLGWSDSSGSTCLMPGTVEVGTTVPDERPKRDLTLVMQNLSVSTKKPKQSKEEKAAKKAAKAAEKKAAKDAALAAARGSDEEDDDVELVKASKAELKKIKKDVAKRRKGGEDCTTDDELEKSGFMAQ